MTSNDPFQASMTSPYFVSQIWVAKSLWCSHRAVPGYDGDYERKHKCGHADAYTAIWYTVIPNKGMFFKNCTICKFCKILLAVFKICLIWSLGILLFLTRQTIMYIPILTGLQTGLYRYFPEC